MFELRPYLINGVRRSSELLSETGVTRSTLLRAFRREQSQTLRLGHARATQYAARQKLPGLSADEFPVFRVDDTGKVIPAGTLFTLAASESAWMPNETIIDGLPPEMHDVAPRGFMGRAYARRYHAELGLPEDVTHWSDHHVLIALSRRGEDLPGNLIIGHESFDRFQGLQHKSRSVADFDVLAEAALAGEHVGSSAGGEQPKFTALVNGQHQLVKFASNATDNARRWQDLLTLEHIALETLSGAGIVAAETELHDVANFRCLMVRRFDRIDTNGRRAVLTLAALSAQIDDLRIDSSWADVADSLERSKIINSEDKQRIALLDAFGALIANTDRHLYNVLLFPTSNGYTLAPAFDQLPMAYAPPASGNLRNTAISEPRPTVNTLAVWDEAQALAKTFWQRAADQRLSESMQAIVSEHAKR